MRTTKKSEGLKALVKAEKASIRNASGISPPPLKEIAKLLKEAHAQAELALADYWEYGRTCGELLETAKSLCVHGEYEKWVAKHTAISPDTALRYRNIYKHWANTASVRDLPVTVAVKLLPKYSGKELEKAATKEREVVKAKNAKRRADAKAMDIHKNFSEIIVKAPDKNKLPIWAAKPKTYQDDIALDSIGADIRDFLAGGKFLLYPLTGRLKLVEKLERLQTDISTIITDIKNHNEKIGKLEQFGPEQIGGVK